MGFTEQDEERVWLLDGQLRQDDTMEMFVTEDDEGFYPWYARLLSTLVLATNGRDLVFTSTVADGSTARLIVVTDLTVLVADVADTAGGETVPVRMAPITAIESLSLSTSMRYDVRGSVKTAWPGVLTVSATFKGLGEVQFVGDSYDRHREDRVGDISRLLAILRAQLDV